MTSSNKGTRQEADLDTQVDDVFSQVRGKPEEDWSAVIRSVAVLSRDQVAEIRRTGTTDSVNSEGRPLVLLSTTGARSGKTHHNPVMRVERDGVYVAVASLGGAPRNPDWYHNIKMNPHVRLMDGSVEGEYLAEEVFGSERDEWLAVAVEAFPDYAAYQQRCERHIPVFVLRPRT